jgi:hypothetical protein
MSTDNNGLSEREVAAIERLKTVDECTQFAVNMKEKAHLVRAANIRAVDIMTAGHSTESDVLRDAWSVLYAYEQVLFLKHGKRLQAQHTRRAIDNHGMLGAVELIVGRPAGEDDGFTRLVAAGMPEKTFEALVLRHPQHFTEKAIRFAREKIADRQQAGA